VVAAKPRLRLGSPRQTDYISAEWNTVLESFLREMKWWEVNRWCGRLTKSCSLLLPRPMPELIPPEQNTSRRHDGRKRQIIEQAQTLFNGSTRFLERGVGRFDQSLTIHLLNTAGEKYRESEAEIVGIHHHEVGREVYKDGGHFDAGGSMPNNKP